MVLSFMLHLQAEKIDIQIAYGGWSLSPFITSVEKETERIIGDEVYNIVQAQLPGIDLTAFQSDLDLTSSGQSLTFSLWLGLGQNRFFLGVRGQYYKFKLPYSLDSVQSISLLGFPLAELESHVDGVLNLSSAILSPLVRWTALSSKALSLSLYGGLAIFHYSGDYTLNGDILIKTPLGDFEYHGEDVQDLDALRAWSDRIPTWIVSPSLGLMMQVKLSRELGILLDVSISHGLFFSAGIFFSVGSPQP